MAVVTRFAPSPTGDLHIGHAYAAVFAHRAAQVSGGRHLVRIDDIDHTRCRDGFIDRNLEDLAWLGLTWETPVLRQSRRLAEYRAALHMLTMLGVTYPCFCTRKEILAEIDASAGAPHEAAPDGSAIYPGKCRGLSAHERARRLENNDTHALRLDMVRATEMAGPLTWMDAARGEQIGTPSRFGDIVLARKDLGASYHLSVVVDDAAQGVTLITRGEDLFDASHVHRLLYALLNLPVPTWHHHRLCRDETGRRLAKRADDLTIRALRDKGLSPGDVLAMARRAAGEA